MTDTNLEIQGAAMNDIPASDLSGLDIEEEMDNEGEKINSPFDPASVDILDKKISINALLERLIHNELNLSPDFQRRANLWDDVRKSRLVESMLLRIPLPSFYFSEDANGNFEVVDGLQRLCAIFHFIDHAALNKATSAKLNPLRLTGLQYLTENHNLSFSELSRPFQRRIKELEIHVNVIRATTPKEVMFNVFARLNQGGLPLSAQEIRNAIYPGIWRKQVRDLAEGRPFILATSAKVPTDRQQDMEMILRFVALWTLGRPFLRPGNQVLDKFLNDTVEYRLSSLSPAQWNDVIAAFNRGLTAATAIFQEHAFRKSYGNKAKSPMNKGLFEAQLVTLAELSDNDIENLTKNRHLVSHAFSELITKENKFTMSMRSGTGHAESSNARIAGLREIFHGVLHA
jgi:hypothetical protein